LELPDLSAQLAGTPLSASLGIGLASPHAFSGRLDVTEWDLGDLLAFVPSVPHPAPVDGALTARAEAEGTLEPLKLTTQGAGRLDRFRAGPVPMGDIPFRWTSERDAIVVSVVEARPFGGKPTAEARIPVGRKGPIEGAADLSGIDTTLLSAAIPGG